MRAATYTVYQAQVDVTQPDTLDPKPVDAWIVNRIEFDTAWFVARYRNEQTAHTVAAILTTLADKEV